MTATDTLTALRKAYRESGKKASAVISAALARLPRQATLTLGRNVRTNEWEWHLQVPLTRTNVRVEYAAGLKALAAAVDAAASEAVEVHGWDPAKRAARQIRAATVHFARCGDEECRRTLTPFDLEASAVEGLCFDCA